MSNDERNLIRTDVRRLDDRLRAVEVEFGKVDLSGSPRWSGCTCPPRRPTTEARRGAVRAAAKPQRRGWGRETPSAAAGRGRQCRLGPPRGPAAARRRLSVRFSARSDRANGPVFPVGCAPNRDYGNGVAAADRLDPRGCDSPTEAIPRDPGTVRSRTGHPQPFSTGESPIHEREQNNRGHDHRCPDRDHRCPGPPGYSFMGTRGKAPATRRYRVFPHESCRYPQFSGNGCGGGT